MPSQQSNYSTQLPRVGLFVERPNYGFCRPQSVFQQVDNRQDRQDSLSPSHPIRVNTTDFWRTLTESLGKATYS